MEKKIILLPADDAVQNWFEENIDKECSTSSAIYKFRLWLESLQMARQAGAEWVKASEFDIKRNVTYHAIFEDGNQVIKGSGFFNINDWFMWDNRDIEERYKDDWDKLLILDESEMAAAEPTTDWAKDYDTLYYIVMPVLNKLRHRTDNDTRMIEMGSDIRNTIHKALADIRNLPPPISSNEPPFLVQSDVTAASAREEDAVSFAEWIREAGIEPTFGNKWVDFSKSKDNRYTTAELYELFKQQ